MSIEFKNVSIRTRRTLTPVLLENLNIRLAKGDHVAFLSPGAALRALIGVISGAKAPEGGTVVRNDTISWPIPGSGFLHKHLNFIANARFVARLYGVDQAPYLAKVLDLARIVDLAEERIDHCPKDAVARFSFALGACLPFDMYLLTTTKIGNKRDSERYAELIADLGRDAGLLIATSSGKAIRDFCDQAYVFDRGRAHHYTDVEAAAEHMARIAKPNDGTDEEDLPAEDERILDDF
jgi:capsular polysaccharide transport system ATP-binding protein